MTNLTLLKKGSIRSDAASTMSSSRTKLINYNQKKINDIKSYRNFIIDSIVTGYWLGDRPLLDE